MFFWSSCAVKPFTSLYLVWIRSFLASSVQVSFANVISIYFYEHKVTDWLLNEQDTYSKKNIIILHFITNRNSISCIVKKKVELVIICPIVNLPCKFPRSLFGEGYPRYCFIVIWRCWAGIKERFSTIISILLQASLSSCHIKCYLHFWLASR